jgi:phosphoesterase RecJ-like protein
VAQRELFQSLSVDGITMLARGMAATRRSHSDEYAWVVIDDAVVGGLELDREDFRDLVQHLIAVSSVRVAATLTPVPSEKKIRLSLRAKDGINVEPIARRLGGGGHAQACGATIRGLDVAKLERQVEAAVGKVLAKGA